MSVQSTVVEEACKKWSGVKVSQLLYGSEEDQLVETGLPLLQSNFVKKTSVNTGRRHCAKKNETFR